MHAKEAERVAATRERQQLELDRLREEEKAREEEAKQKKLAELKKVGFFMLPPILCLNRRWSRSLC